MAVYSHIIWDWNGTLFDDASACVRAMNQMLGRRGMPTLSSVEQYRRLFGFPVADYYRRVGFDFDKESLADLSAEFVAIYHPLAADCALFGGAWGVCNEAQRRGLRQVVLSASQVDNLVSQVEPFGIAGFFDELLGLPDILAAGKIEIGREYVARAGVGRALLVGDTVHDKEVADALGADCVLVAGGHQDRARLEGCGARVVDRLGDLRGFWASDQLLAGVRADCAGSSMLEDLYTDRRRETQLDGHHPFTIE